MHKAMPVVCLQQSLEDADMLLRRPFAGSGDWQGSPGQPGRPPGQPFGNNIATNIGTCKIPTSVDIQGLTLPLTCLWPGQH